MVVFSTARNLRVTMAMCSILAMFFGGITMYKNIFGGVLVGRFLKRGRHTWLQALVLPGGERRDMHEIDLDYDDRTDEIAVWLSAGFAMLAGALGLLKLCIDAYQRRRINLGGFYETSTSTFRNVLAQIPAATALVAFLMSFATVVFTWHQRIAMQQNTCYWQLGQQGDAVFKCTRELAVCDISPYLLKGDNSDRAQRLRAKACAQLQFSHTTLLALVVALLYLVGSYGAQVYLSKKQARFVIHLDEKTMSARSSTDSFGRRERSRRHSWSSAASSQSIEKAE